MRTFLGATALAAAMSFGAAAQAQFLIIGNDEKLAFKDGKPVLSPPGKDTVTIVDISDGSNPRIVANLPVENSIIGPPTNLAITPDNKLALVASSIDVVKDGDNLKNMPGNKVYVIDLTASPPAVIATVQTGKQPSGLAINRAGNLALVANRADNSVSVLSISGKIVSVVSTVAVAPADAPAQQPSAIAITPDGKLCGNALDQRLRRFGTRQRLLPPRPCDRRAADDRRQDGTKGRADRGRHPGRRHRLQPRRPKPLCG